MDANCAWARRIMGVTNGGKIMHETFLTVQELSTYLKCHYSTIYRMLRRCELPTFRVGRDYRFDLAQIEEWAGAHTIIPQSLQDSTLGSGRHTPDPQTGPASDRGAKNTRCEARTSARRVRYTSPL